MQPYFVPYAGYFRLLTSADLFVIYDCVQFPRRGWVHRNQVLTHQGKMVWLTLPITKCPQKTTIQDLRFSPNSESWHLLLHGIQGAQNADQQEITLLMRHLSALKLSVVEYLQESLQQICTELLIDCPIIRSSSLNLDSALKGQDRILEICGVVGAKTYINSPGGRELYDAAAFRNRGINLQFLKPYEGSYLSILQRLLLEDRTMIRHEIDTQSVCA